MTKQGLVSTAIVMTVCALHAAASTKVEYCDGRVLAVAFTTQVVPGNDMTSRIDYFVSLVNASHKPLKITAKFRYSKTPVNIANQLSVEKTLQSAVLEKVLLGSQTVNNPAGRGKIGEGAEKESLSVFCER